MEKELLEKNLENYLLGKGDETNTMGDELIGLYVIIRGYDSGVHFGKLKRAKKGDYLLEDSRRLWRFWNKKGVGLTDLANFGLSDNGKSKICSPVPLIRITDDRISEIIPVSIDMVEHFQTFEHAKQD